METLSCHSNQSSGKNQISYPTEIKKKHKLCRHRLAPVVKLLFLSEKHAQNLLMALCSEPKKRGNSYKKIFMEVIEHGMIG